VLSKAKDRAHSIRCVSNFHQIGVASTVYSDEFNYFPPGVLPGVTQWDLCLTPYAGSGNNVTVTNATSRSGIFTCPSAKVPNASQELNYSANPNVCKDWRFSTLVKPSSVPRPTEIILAADGIQYQTNGDAQAIFWAVQNSAGTYISYNNGLPANSALPILVGPDQDAVLADADPAGANLRYRHSGQLIALSAAGNTQAYKKGRVTEGEVYTDY
jgi:hypothetical protein